MSSSLDPFAKDAGFVSLRVKLAVPIVAIVLGTALFTLLFVPSRVERLALSLATQRAEAIASSIALAVQAGVEFDDERAIKEIISQMGAVDGVSACLVFSHDGSPLGRFVASGDDASTAGLEALRNETKDMVVTDEHTLRVVRRISTRDPKLSGRLVMAFSLARMESERRDNVVAIGFASALVALLALVLGLLLGSRVARPIRELALATSAIVGGNDLTVRIDVHATDESGVLARSFAEMVAHLRDVLLRLRDLATGLPRMSEAVSATAADVNASASAVLARVEETSAVTASTLRSLIDTTRSIAALDQNVDAAAAAIGETERGNAVVDQAVTGMVGSVTATARAVEQLTRAVDDTAVVVRSQDGAMKAMMQNVESFNRSTQEIRDAAAATATAAAVTQNRAQTGVGSIAKTLDGIRTIHSASSTASTIIRELDERISEIDRIVVVIRDISEQVTLFALNAAIVSAQAGERGESFAIIGREIKALAQRTASSTTAISELIGDIQMRSQAAREAMQSGEAAVEAGLTLGEEAAGALSEIASAASTALVKAKQIAEGTAVQVRDSGLLGRSLEQIAGSVAQISAVAAAQTTHNREILSSSQNMSDLANRVAQAVTEQRQRAARVEKAIGVIRESTDTVRRAQSQQTREAEQVRAAVVSIEEIARHESAAVARLDETVAGLKERATTLTEQVSRFKL